MTTLADIVRQYGPAYEEKYGDRMLPSHRRVLRDIVLCRTAALGGHMYYCADCEATHYQYHSCQNRHCPQCQHQGEQWLARQRDLLLPVPYFMVTFTLPAALHEVARQHQNVIYNSLFRASAEALQQLAQDPRYVGGQIGMVGVLHTWGRNLSYHPHVHYLVPGGGWSKSDRQWLPARRNFFVPVKALSVLFRAKFRDALRQTDLFTQIPAAVWQQDWVVHCKPVGKGVGALKYLAPYIFRVAISNRRILKATNGHVTFRYRESDTGCWRTCTLTADEFLRRFLQHVLPKGFVKVRYYGLFSPSWRQHLPMIRDTLTVPADEDGCASTLASLAQVVPALPVATVSCPHCGQSMQWVKRLRPSARCPP
nr:IS91 family transposase [Anaerolineae bacterium]